MSLLSSISGFFGRAVTGAEGTGPTKATLVVDMSGLSSGNGQRERMSPRDQVALLQQVAVFAEKESLKVSVVMDGRPLREAPEGKDFKTVKVCYVEQTAQAGARVLALAGKGRDAVVITPNLELEAQARARGLVTLRAGTFRKGMEEAGQGGGGGRSGGRGRRRQRPRRNGGPDRRGSASQGNSKPPKESAPKDGVSDLIDLV